MEELLEISENLIASVPTDFQRYLFDQVQWQNRLIGIKGARGTGKSTMLLQWLRLQELPVHNAAYFSLDHFYFSGHSLWETGTQFQKQGGQVMVLDEVHKYPDWAREIKNLYDSYPHLQIIFTGSSIIDITRQQADLSRRVLMYELHGLSFREYLAFHEILQQEAISLEQIIDPGKPLRKLFPESFKPLEHFASYLSEGYYPFSAGPASGYQQRLHQLVRAIVEYDMAELKGFDIRNARKILQLLFIIAQNVPFKPNLSSLAEKSNIHRNSLGNYLHFLEEARLISLLYPAGSSVATLQKPEKIYLNNTNLVFALSEAKPEKGTIREIFFYSMANVVHHVTQPQKADFLVDGKYSFEIGGKNKPTNQIEGIPNAYIIKDDLEFTVGKSLPLWLFGFLY